MTDPSAGTRWKLTDLEFVLLGADDRIGGLPAPFAFTSRTRYADDYEAEKAAVRADLALLAGPELDAFTATLSRPDLMVVAHAWDTEAPADPARRIRVHAVRRGARGYVITQRPGETLAHAGGFDIADCAPAELGRTVIGLLPGAIAGRDAAAVRGELADAGNEPYAGDDVAVAVAPAAALTDCGFVKVIQGHLGFRVRGIVEVGLAWRDIPGDGRYAITVGEPVDTAVGMDSAAQADWVDAQMAHIMTRLSA